MRCAAQLPRMVSNLSTTTTHGTATPRRCSSCSRKLSSVVVLRIPPLAPFSPRGSRMLKSSKYKILKNTSALALAQMISRIATIFYVAALARYVGTAGIGEISTATSLNGILILIVGPGLSILFVKDVAADTRKASSYVSNMLLLRLLLIIPFVLVTVGSPYLGHYLPETVTIIHLYTLVYI